VAPDDAGDEGDVDQPPNAERQPEQGSDANRQQEQADDKEGQQPDAAPRAPEVEPADLRNPRKNQIASAAPMDFRPASKTSARRAASDAPGAPSLTR